MFWSIQEKWRVYDWFEIQKSNIAELFLSSPVPPLSYELLDRIEQHLNRHPEGYQATNQVQNAASSPHLPTENTEWMHYSHLTPLL